MSTSFTIIWIVLVTAVTLFYINFPPPQLSATLKGWLKKGKFFNFNDHDIFYIVEDGSLDDDSTLLLIHGFPTSSHDYVKILDDLKEQYDRIILVDMLGFGFSDKPKNHKYLIMEQADIMEALLQSQSVTHAHVMSHDYGDTVALELLHRFNNDEGKLSLLSLCMLNGGLFEEFYHPVLIQKLLLIPVLGNVLSHLNFYTPFQRGLGSTFASTRQPTEDEMRDFYALNRHKDGTANSAKLLDYIPQRSLHKDRWVGALQKTKIPVHMIYGPADPVNPPVFAQHYKKVVPSPSIEVLPSDVGHYPQWEHPEAVAKSYINFIKKLK